MTARWQPEWALELALGTLVGPERDTALAVLATSAEARAEVAAARELVSGLAEQAAAPAAQHDAASRVAGLRDQVMRATQPANACLGGFARRVGELFDLDEEEARKLLATIDGEMTFEAADVPGVELAHVAAGPRVAGLDAGIVRFPPGLAFPRHEHLGPETQIVLTGSFTTDDGHEYLPGDTLRMEAGSRHSFVVGKDERCVIAVVLHADIRIL